MHGKHYLRNTYRSQEAGGLAAGWSVACLAGRIWPGAGSSARPRWNCCGHWPLTPRQGESRQGEGFSGGLLSVLAVPAGRERRACQWSWARTRSDMFQFVNDEVVVAFGSQPARHPPGSSAIAGVFDHPGGGRAQSGDAGIFPQPDARAGVDDTGRVVRLVAAQRHDQQRYPAVRAFITVPWPP